MARRERALLAACSLGVAGFVALFGAAAFVYPGGTWFDRGAKGHSFWLNFLCDLLHAHALNGQDNARGAALTRAAMLSLLVGLAAFFSLVALLETPVSRAGRVARITGALACMCGVAVPLTPSDLYPRAHTAAVLGSCVPAVVAVGASLLVCMRAAGVPRVVRWAALATLGAGVLDAVGYACSSAAITRKADYALPVLQRVATASLLVWVCAVLVVRGRSAPHRG